jgi:hypothetical protein
MACRLWRGILKTAQRVVRAVSAGETEAGRLGFARPGTLLCEPPLHDQGFASDLIQSLNTSNSGEWALFFGYTR